MSWDGKLKARRLSMPGDDAQIDLFATAIYCADSRAGKLVLPLTITVRASK